jgi:hypothetical protein
MIRILLLSLFAALGMATPAIAMPSVPDIASLKAMGASSPIFPNVSVVGYYTGTQEGGGLFTWDAASTASDDGCTVFQAFTGATPVTTGRWKRTGPLSLMHSRWCGAKGDGTADDTAAINNAVATCGRILTHALGTGPVTCGVYIDPGQTLVTSDIVVPRGVDLFGLDPNLSVILCKATTYCWHIATTAPAGSFPYPVIQGVAFFGFNAAVTAIFDDGSRADETQQFTLDRVHLYNFSQSALLLHGTNRFTCRDSYVHNSGDSTHAAVAIDNGEHFTWEQSCSIENMNATALAALTINRTFGADVAGHTFGPHGNILVGNETENTYNSSLINIHAEIEGPGGPCIQLGFGWTGGPGEAVRASTIGGSCTDSSDPATFLVQAKNTSTIHVLPVFQAIVGVTGVFDLQGTGNTGWLIDPRAEVDIWSGAPYVKVNGVTRADANFTLPWSQGGYGLTVPATYGAGTPIPGATTVVTGTVAIVTNASVACTVGATYSTGGSNVCWVRSNGTNWIYM